jgi:hypothetical protein
MAEHLPEENACQKRPGGFLSLNAPEEIPGPEEPVQNPYKTSLLFIQQHSLERRKNRKETT